MKKEPFRDETAPDHSTLTKFTGRLERHGKEALLEELPKEVVMMAMTRGVGFGSIQVGDSTHTVDELEMEPFQQGSDLNELPGQMIMLADGRCTARTASLIMGSRGLGESPVRQTGRSVPGRGCHDAAGLNSGRMVHAVAPTIRRTRISLAEIGNFER
ncbi:MAG: hypothetical protein ACOC7N_03150 [Chloroflexota bacterium]